MPKVIKFHVKKDDYNNDKDQLAGMRRDYGDEFVEGKMNIIIFATDREIKRDCVQGDGIPDCMQELQELFGDTTSLCEDYLIHTKCDDVDINVELWSRGFVNDDRLEECGWG